MMDQANKKTYLYKNQAQVDQKRIATSLNYNKVSFHNRKELEYERNLQKYYPKEESPSPKKGQNRGTGNGTKAII